MNRTARTEALVELGCRLSDAVVAVATRLDHPTALAADYRREYDLLRRNLRARIPLPSVFNPRLTARERVVVELAADGMAGLAIAAALGISHNTVKIHLKNARRKIQ